MELLNQQIQDVLPYCASSKRGLQRPWQMHQDKKKKLSTPDQQLFQAQFSSLTNDSNAQLRLLCHACSYCTAPLSPLATRLSISSKQTELPLYAMLPNADLQNEYAFRGSGIPYVAMRRMQRSWKNYSKSKATDANRNLQQYCLTTQHCKSMPRACLKAIEVESEIYKQYTPTRI